MPISTRSARADESHAVVEVGAYRACSAAPVDSRHLQPYVVVLEDLLACDLCDQLVAEFAACDEWQPALVGDRVVAPDIRNVDVIEMSRRSVIERNPKARKGLEQGLYSAGLRAVRLYEQMFPACRIVEGQAFELLRYRTGGFYRKHTDSFRRVPRSLSCSFALNDDFGGGDWSFFDGEYRLSPPKGSVVLFPSNFMFPHEILEVSSGTRYSVVTWMI